MRERLTIALAIAAGALLSFDLYKIFLSLPDELMQGAIYRIIFFHVPAGIVGMVGYFLAMTFGVLYLSGKELKWDAVSASIVEVSLVFSCINLITGSIWARIIWGVWWTWDYRLTSQLICVLIFFGYLLLRRAIEDPTRRAGLSAVLCIFGCVNVVIVWKSIEWFRNNHPGPVLSIRTGGGHMDPRMEHVLEWNFLALLLLAAALTLVRSRLQSAEREIDSLRRYANGL